MTDNNAHRGAEAQLTLRNSPAYRVAYSMYVALGGDPITEFSSVEEIYDAIDVLFGKGNNRITVETIALEIVENGDYNFDDEEVTGYKPVNIKVEIPQKYTDEQVENIRVEAENNGYNTGYGVGINDGYSNGYGVGYAEGDAAGQQTGYTTGYGEGFTQGETEGYNDGYAEGLDDGAEDQKALLEDITITENGVYEKEDGYKKVTVEMAAVPSGDGFDFSVIGYDDELSNSINSITLEQINYSKTFADNWNSNNIYPSFSNNKNLVYLPSIDVSMVRGFANTFSNCSNLQYVPYLNATTKLEGMATMFVGCSSLKYVGGFADTSNIRAANSMFSGCSSLTTVPLFSTKLVSSFNEMFKNCSSLTTVPQFDTSRATTMNDMFTGCSSLTTVPQFNTSNVTSMRYVFYGCKALTTAPQFDTSKVTDVYGMFRDCSSLTSIPQLNFSSVSTLGGYMFGYSNMPNITTLGGFVDFGKSLTGSTGLDSFINYLPNLTHDSLMNVINNLYDRATAGLSVLTLKLHANHLAILTDDEKAIATNKGWIIS